MQKKNSFFFFPSNPGRSCKFILLGASHLLGAVFPKVYEVSLPNGSHFSPEKFIFFTLSFPVYIWRRTSSFEDDFEKFFTFFSLPGLFFFCILLFGRKVILLFFFRVFFSPHCWPLNIDCVRKRKKQRLRRKMQGKKTCEKSPQVLTLYEKSAFMNLGTLKSQFMRENLFFF